MNGSYWDRFAEAVSPSEYVMLVEQVGKPNHAEVARLVLTSEMAVGDDAKEGVQARAEIRNLTLAKKVSRTVVDEMSWDLERLVAGQVCYGYYGEHLDKMARASERRARTRQYRKEWGIRSGSGRPRDSQRSKVYAAERPLNGFGRVFDSIAEIQEYVDDLVGSVWWGGNFGSHRPVRVVKGRKGTSAWAASDGGSISLPTWAWTEFVVLHELAHIATDRATPGLASHGPEFVRSMLALVEHKMGVPMAGGLWDAYAEHKVKSGTTRPEVLMVRAAKPKDGV